MRLSWIICVVAIFRASAALADSYNFGGATFEFKLPPGDCYLENTTPRAQRFIADVKRMPTPEIQYIFLAARCADLDNFRAGHELMSYYAVVGQMNPATGEPLLIPGMTRKALAAQMGKGRTDNVNSEAINRVRERSSGVYDNFELKNMKMGEAQVHDDSVYVPMAINVRSGVVDVAYALVNASFLMSGRLFSIVNAAPHRGEQTYAALFQHSQSIIASITAANPGSERALPKRESAEATLPSAPLAAPTPEPETKPTEAATAVAPLPAETKPAMADELQAAPAENRRIRNILLTLGIMIVGLLALAGLVAIILLVFKKLRRA